ncbi:MAG TPA: ATP-binding protein [Blastocatellia bacterium]|nr:ATP-binding protein [Blastocatellia bacterium]
MTNITSLAIEHLLLRLRPLNRALRAAVERQADIAARLARPDLTILCVTDDQVNTLLSDVDRMLIDGDALTGAARLTSEETCEQERLRLRARESGAQLPMDRLAQVLELSSFEEEAILLCAAPEIDNSYERIYAYILDDLNRRFPCLELLCNLTAASVTERLERRKMLGRFGRLRRLGILQTHGESATALRQELRFGAGLFEFLIGAAEDTVNLLKDRAEIRVSQETSLPPEVDRKIVNRTGLALSNGLLSVVGIWGPEHSARDDLAVAVAAAARMRLRRLIVSDLLASPRQLEESFREIIQTTSALDAILWIKTDLFTELEEHRLRDALAAALSCSKTPFILTGRYPWRPAQLLETHDYFEFELGLPGYQTCKSKWAEAIPELDEPGAGKLAARFRLNSSEMRAVARVARTRAHIFSNGRPAEIRDQIESACAAVTRKRSDHFATVIKPKRGADDLILPVDLHKQVIEVAHFFRAWSRVDEEWGFACMSSRGGGVKALFTGEPGTGKSLAAEVIAGTLHLPLLKVDLARVVSKWVGETEKNLETVFREAEESHAVLLFDEAESLFGQRGEVRHGTDRYANLEVGYLLQRLEDYYGLVILSSNLKDRIDAAFIRRFQVIINFPYPGPSERGRIWQIAFPSSAPLHEAVDLQSLQQLELTGAGIVSAARTAALLAADEEANAITMQHVVRAIARQFKREARILPRTQLGSYASLLQGF